MPPYRITFLRDLMGVPFPIASVTVHNARTPERARRAAELKLMRRRQIEDWRMCADALDVKAAAKRQGE
jgi:hypothetical protein